MMCTGMRGIGFATWCGPLTALGQRMGMRRIEICRGHRKRRCDPRWLTGIRMWYWRRMERKAVNSKRKLRVGDVVRIVSADYEVLERFVGSEGIVTHCRDVLTHPVEGGGSLMVVELPYVVYLNRLANGEVRLGDLGAQFAPERADEMVDSLHVDVDDKSIELIWHGSLVETRLVWLDSELVQRQYVERFWDGIAELAYRGYKRDGRGAVV